MKNDKNHPELWDYKEAENFKKADKYGLFTIAYKYEDLEERKAYLLKEKEKCNNVLQEYHLIKDDDDKYNEWLKKEGIEYISRVKNIDSKNIDTSSFEKQANYLLDEITDYQKVNEIKATALSIKEKKERYEYLVKTLKRRLPKLKTKSMDEAEKIFEGLIRELGFNIDEEQPVPLINPNQKNKIRWTGEVVDLVTMFYDMHKQHLIACSKEEMYRLLINNFIQKNGEPLSYTYVKEVCKPGQPLKRSTDKNRIDFTPLLNKKKKK